MEWFISLIKQTCFLQTPITIRSKAPSQDELHRVKTIVSHQMTLAVWGWSTRSSHFLSSSTITPLYWCRATVRRSLLRTMRVSWSRTWAGMHMLRGNTWHHNSGACWITDGAGLRTFSGYRRSAAGHTRLILREITAVLCLGWRGGRTKSKYWLTWSPSNTGQRAAMNR
jgi:hypothetical protein